MNTSSSRAEYFKYNLYIYKETRGISVFLNAGLNLPPPVKQRGRPKGHDLTVVGLPAKRARKGKTNKPCSFSKLHVSEKERGRYNVYLHVHCIMSRIVCVIVLSLAILRDNTLFCLQSFFHGLWTKELWRVLSRKTT